MDKPENKTEEKIISAALALFSERGISKTSMEEIAYQAGVTRVTVYRHFPDKKELIQAAYLQVEKIFQKGLADLEGDAEAEWEDVLHQIGESLSTLPRGNVFARMDEIKRLYPEVYNAIQEVRAATLNGIFARLFATDKRRESLRPGLNRQFVQAVFWELAINLFDNPRFQSVSLSDAELYHAMTDILLHGVLKS